MRRRKGVFDFSNSGKKKVLREPASLEISALTGQVGTGTNVSGYTTAQALAWQSTFVW